METAKTSVKNVDNTCDISEMEKGTAKKNVQSSRRASTNNFLIKDLYDAYKILTLSETDKKIAERSRYSMKNNKFKKAEKEEKLEMGKHITNNVEKLVDIVEKSKDIFEDSEEDSEEESEENNMEQKLETKTEKENDKYIEMEEQLNVLKSEEEKLLIKTMTAKVPISPLKPINTQQDLSTDLEENKQDFDDIINDADDYQFVEETYVNDWYEINASDVLEIMS